MRPCVIRSSTNALSPRPIVELQSPWPDKQFPFRQCPASRPGMGRTVNGCLSPHHLCVILHCSGTETVAYLYGTTVLTPAPATLVMLSLDLAAVGGGRGVEGPPPDVWSGRGARTPPLACPGIAQTLRLPRGPASRPAARSTVPSSASTNLLSSARYTSQTQSGRSAPPTRSGWSNTA
jgi:hypothetical protein